MQNVTIPLDTATISQLTQFATINLGLEITGKPTRDELVAMIKSCYMRDTITIQLTELTAVLEKKIAAGEVDAVPIGVELDITEDGKLVPTVTVQEVPEPDPYEGDATPNPEAKAHVQEVEKDPSDPNHWANQMVTIFIDAIEEPGGSDPVWVSVNGKGIFLLRRENIEVKQKFVHALENAIRDVGEQATDDAGNPTGEINWRQVPAYPWRIVKEARAA